MKEKGYKGLKVYQLAFQAAMDIYLCKRTAAWLHDPISRKIPIAQYLLPTTDANMRSYDFFM